MFSLPVTAVAQRRLKIDSLHSTSNGRDANLLQSPIPLLEEHGVKKTLIAAIQICFLVALSQLGYLCAGRFNLPLPGNLVGLLLLLALLRNL